MNAKKINFLHIGPGRTGTKWLSKVLNEHPKIFVPEIDIYFFDRNEIFMKGESWYHAFFKKASDSHEAIGELSHDYLYSEIASKRIKDYNSDMKIIVTLRNPADLCYSIYNRVKNSGFDSKTNSNIIGDSFEESMEINNELLKFGLLSKNLNFYLERFDKKNILILDFDELIHDKNKYLKKIFSFLNVNHIEELSNVPIFNKSRSVRTEIIGIIAKKGSNLLRSLDLLKFLSILKNSRFINNIVYRKEIKPLSEKSREYFIKKYFINDIKLLEEKTQINLSKWYNSDN